MLIFQHVQWDHNVESVDYILHLIMYFLLKSAPHQPALLLHSQRTLPNATHVASKMYRYPRWLACYSHSIVAGGLLEISYVTREIPGTSLIIRLDTFAKKA